MNRKIRVMYGGLMMALKGAGGIIINEISINLIDGPQTAYELGKLPRGYFHKGLGHMLRRPDLIFKGKELIKEYREDSRKRNEIFESAKGVAKNA